MAKQGEGTKWLLVAAVVVVAYFLIVGVPWAAEDDDMIPPPAGVFCNKDFTTSVDLISRNHYARAEVVDTDDEIVYNVWRLTNGVMIPQAPLSEGDALEIGYDQEFLVVLGTNASLGEADVLHQEKTFKVDQNCNVPAPQIFYAKTIPPQIEGTFESTRITGPNADDNRVEMPQEVERTMRALFNGRSRTGAEAIIVFDVDRTVIDRVSSNLQSASTPISHTTGAGERSYAFRLGEFDGSNDVQGNFDFRAHRDAPLGDYNVTYTIYLYQTGYTDTITGDWVSGNAIENNDDDALLPTYDGAVYFEITS